MRQHNLLLIGLGGTGCAVVRELKKKLYIEWRSRGNTGPYPEIYVFQDDFGPERVESRIATLSVDSNEKDLEGHGERTRSWRVFGETLRLGDKEKVLMDPSGLERVLGSIERYPGIAPWVRQDLEFVRDITRGSTEPAGCNQIRRMGRLALANGNSTENVIQRVAGRLSELSKNGQVGAEIHIACTLAAGTGSGSLIDVIAQVQRYLKSQHGIFEVYVHGFATANDVGDINTGNFYANQYAALLELNGFRLGIYQPWDIAASQQAKRLTLPEHGKSTGDLTATYRSVALITDTTEGGMNVPLVHQVENAAEFIFQLAVRQMGDVPKQLRDALTLEDRKHYPADANGGNRSTAFIGYGVQRVAIPEREIREKLSYSFARQFLVKALYNNWDGRYRESPRSFAKDGFVDSRRGLWRVTREHLYLDIVEDVTGQREFETYETEWRNELEKQATRVLGQLGDEFTSRKQWITDYDQRAEKLWEKGFRSRGDSGGVVDYFTVRKDPIEIVTRARNIRAIIEKDLLFGTERMDPEYALHHLPGAVDFLTQRIENDRLAFGELELKAVDQKKEADRFREEIRAEYAKCGRWAKGKHERLFKQYRDFSMRYYYWRTIEHAAQYGQEFCRKLIDEVRSLHQQIVLFDTRMKQIVTNADGEISVRIRESNGAESRDDVVYLVDARYVNEAIRDRFECNKSLQDRHIDTAMDALKLLRGDRVEFAAFTEKMPVDATERVAGSFVDELRQVSELNAIEAHREVRENDREFEGIFGQNIVRKLYNDYGGRVDGELEQWLRELMGKAMPMVAFDPNEEPMDLPTQGPVLRRCVFVPKCRAVPNDFERHLRQRVEAIIGGQGNCKAVETHYQEVPEDRNPCEIVIVSVAFFFGARHTRVVHGLKKNYLDRLLQKSDKESLRAYFELHTESHQPRLPDLMKLGRKEVLADHFAPVLLAAALGLMQVAAEDGKQVLFGKVDEFGRVKDKVETGMRVNAKIREAAGESEARFGQKIPLATIVLYTLYFDQFSEGSLPHVEKLVRARMAEGVAADSVEKLLDTMSGQCFLLSGKKEDDKMYKFVDEKTTEAAKLLRLLTDRSTL